MKAKIKEINGFEDDWETAEKVKTILNWSCMNSIKENRNYFLQNTKLATIHLENTKDTKRVPTNKNDSTLKEMYSRKIRYSSMV